MDKQGFLKDEEIMAFFKRFEHILIHLDIDVLDEHFFHSTYFANPNLVGDGAHGGKMKMEKLKQEKLPDHRFGSQGKGNCSPSEWKNLSSKWKIIFQLSILRS